MEICKQCGFWFDPLASTSCPGCKSWSEFVTWIISGDVDIDED